MINPFVSLNQIYKIPITFVISWRGYTGISDAVQHEYMGKITSKILELIGINIIDLTQYDFTVEEILQRLENNYPVSYTHLDVYKRQAYLYVCGKHGILTSEL